MPAVISVECDCDPVARARGDIGGPGKQVVNMCQIGVNV